MALDSQPLPDRPTAGASLGVGTRIQTARLVTGLILFAFLTSHLLNHALGLVSVEAMEWARGYRTAVTRSLPGTVILLGAAIVHLILGVLKFVRRRTLRIGWAEGIQLASGLLIPLLLMRHVLGMRIAHELYGVNDNYEYALWIMWPTEAWRQAILILLAWTHGVIGIHMWLRLKPWYRSLRYWFAAAAALIPALAYAGFAVGVREVRFTTEFSPYFTAAQGSRLLHLMDLALYGYLAVLVLLVSIRLLRRLSERFLPKVAVEYAGGQRYVVPAGFTLLEVSRLHNVPHASICGGRARCSTCRVRILSGQEAQPPPQEAERKVLKRVGATGNVRLACQLRPVGEIRVATLLPPEAAMPGLLVQDRFVWGVEQPVTIMFCDLRGFTALSEQRLPFDVVFLLNQYLNRISEMIEDSGGYVDKYMGDGVMAIFGIDLRPEEGARRALAAARGMSGVLEALNQSLREEIPRGMRIGIALNTGPAILGRVGHAARRGAARNLTALGDTVNTASRLEGLTKEMDVEVIVALATLDAAGVDPEPAMLKEARLRGKHERTAVVPFRRGLDIPIEWVGG